MRYERVTFTIRYRAFDAGERVVVRGTGETAEVESFHAPKYPEDEAIVFLKGRPTGIPAGECDPYLDPAVPVIRTMEFSDDVVGVWIVTPEGVRIMCDSVAGWTRWEDGDRLNEYPDVATAVAAATAYAESIGFTSVQHHPL